MVGGPFHIVVLVFGLLFMAWNARDLYNLLTDPLPSARSTAVLNDLEMLYSNLSMEMERQRSDTQHSAAAAAKRIETLIKMLEDNLPDLHHSAEGVGDVRPALGNASQYLSMANLASGELRRMTRDDNVHGMELEARANIVMAMAEIRAGLESVRAPKWDMVVDERNNRIRHIATNLAFGVLTCGILIFLFLDRRIRELSIAETTAAWVAANPPPWAVGATAKPRTSDMVVNLDDTMVTRAVAAENEPVETPRAASPAETPVAEPVSAASGGENAKLLAAAVARSFHHDLTVINGYSDLLLESMSEDDPVRMDIRAIRRAGERANVLAGQLQCYSDSKPERWEPIEVNRWLESLRARIEALLPPGVKLDYALSPAAGVVRGDSERLEQAIKSLVVNATDAMPAGGEVVIESALHEPARGEVWTTITVRDSGRGIDSTALRHLFDAKTPGVSPASAGIGLPAVAAILEEHSGHVEVESAPGKGSSFHLMIPKAVVARARAASAGARASR